MTSPRNPKADGPGKSSAAHSRDGQPVRVLVVDDHVLARSTTRRQLREVPNLEVVGEAADGFEAVALARTLSPDLVFMDICMPGLDGIEATRRILAESPGIRIIMLSSHEEAYFQQCAASVGAAGYVVKGSGIRDLAAAVKRACASR